MNIISELFAYRRLKPGVDQVEQGIKTKNATKVVAGVVALVTVILQIPSVHQWLLAALVAHPNIGIIIGGISTLLALLHDPKIDPDVGSR
jgi:hypothetical protein